VKTSRALLLSSLIVLAACGEKKAEAAAADSTAMAAPAPAMAPAATDSAKPADSTMARDTTKK
jgi:hypothetical protein